MPFLLLMLLAVVLIRERWPAPAWGEPPAFERLWLLFPTWAGVALLVAAALFIARRTRRAILDDPESREHVLQRYASLRLYHLAAQFFVYGVALFVLGWGWLVQELCAIPSEAAGPATVAPGAELLILAPFLAGLVGSWVCFYDAEKAVHDAALFPLRPFWSRGAYLSFQLRQNLALLVAPLGLIIVEKALQNTLPDGGTLVGVALIAAVFVGLPWILRLVLRLRRLPDGPLRDRLLETARRLNFRFSDILVWNTNGGVVNAMVAGLLPWPRYVLLTDRLVSDLSPEEVEAVFGHEVGHVKHAHMLYYASFLIVSMVAVAWLLNAAVDAIPPVDALLKQNESWATIPFVGILGAYIFLVFGFLSRRCERQADIYGCRAVSCERPDCAFHFEGTPLPAGGRGLCPTGIRTFIEALEKVARLNGISRHRPGWLQSWQHSTIARRVDFLQQVLADPSLEPRFQRTVGHVKWALVLGLGAVLVVLCGVSYHESLVEWATGLASYLPWFSVV